MQSSAKEDGLSDSEADMVAVNPKNTKRRHTNAKEQNYIKSVGSDLGVKVVFEDIVKVLSAEGIDLHGNIPDGYIDDDGVIHIGFTVVNPTKVVFKHELTHYGEGTEAHATYTAAVEKTKLFKEWLQKKTGSNSDSVGELKGIYRDMVKKQRGSLAPKGATKLNNEMFADFSSEVLFDTTSFEQLINQVNAKQKPVVIQYVLDFLAYLKDKLSGKKNITFELKTADKLTTKYDFVCANILHNILAEIMGDLKNIMKPHAKMVLSGILDDKKPVVLEAIQKHGLKIIETMHQDQWVAFVVEN